VVYKEEAASQFGEKTKFVNASSQGQQTEIKLPSLTKQQIAAFNVSAFDKVKPTGPPTGISLMNWSHDSRFVATKSDTSPQVVYVWELSCLELNSVLIMASPV